MTRRVGTPVFCLPIRPAAGVSLYCPRCRSTFSATRGDYWSAPRDMRPRCDCPGRSFLRLVQSRTTLAEIAPSMAEAT